MLVSELLDGDLLLRHVRDGYVDVRKHPTMDLAIYNYSKKCQYEQAWDEVTVKTRGLIINSQDKVIGAGFNKFFNYGEKHVATMDLSGPVQVTDKIDGSLGIVCFYHNELVVATRGSFESEQALFAYQYIKGNFLLETQMLCQTDSTALFEIVYPANRIVVDYGDFAGLYLIGVQSNYELSDGRHIWLSADDIWVWPGRKVKKFSCRSFEEALALPPRNNAEGVVVYFENTGERLKIKQEDYVRLHKLVSNLTEKNIWKALAAGQSLADIAAPLPDEFHAWVNKVGGDLIRQQHEQVKLSLDEFDDILKALPPNWSRKDFALATKDSKRKSQLFFLLDGKRDAMLEYCWKLIEPKG